MKKIVYICIAAFLPLLFAGCGKADPETPALEPGLYLKAVTPGDGVKMITKAGEGESDLNENVLKSVYYFFYAKADDDADPSTALPKLSGHFAGLEAETRTTGVMDTRRIPVSAGIVNDLFPSGTKDCRLVVVANPPASITSVLEGNPTSAQLRGSVITANFKTTDPQEDFVMVCDTLVRVGGRLDVVAATIDAKLKRLANKITVHAKIADGVYDEVAGWFVPQCEGLKVSFCNGFSKANLAGDFSTLATEDRDWFDSPEIGFSTAVHGSGADTTYTCSITAPIYGYPMQWEFADPHEPYFLFELPWMNVGDSKDNTTGPISVYYYKLMLAAKRLDANAWCNVNVTLKILGSPNKVEPAEQFLYEDYKIYDWETAFDSQGNNVEVDIREARYLMVNQKYFILNNQPVWDIPFASSHECEIVNATYYTTNYVNNPPTQTTPASISGLNPACNIRISGNLITFSKELRNDITAGAGRYDYAPYTYNFTIRHVDNHEFSEEITIVQYPSLYIDATVNSMGATVGSRTSTTAYVNNNNSGSIGGVSLSDLGSSTTSGTPGNTNGTMYVVSISSLPNTSNYIIMDPRTQDVDLLLNGGRSWTVTAPALYDGASNRDLKYYYPTSTGEASSNVIAPQFRIASSWGATYEVTFTNAARRCAAYQEDGYPAGRWRVPTRAEVEFMITLSKDNIIPMLFSNGSAYWCASGTITANSNGTITYSTSTGSSHAVRCVYDEWYWKDTDRFVTNTTYPTTGGRLPASATGKKYPTFVWGDMPR